MAREERFPIFASPTMPRNSLIIGGAQLENRVRSSREAANITSHLSKYRSLLPSLALLFHLIEVVSAATPGPVSLDLCPAGGGLVPLPQGTRHADLPGRVRWRSRARPPARRADQVRPAQSRSRCVKFSRRDGRVWRPGKRSSGLFRSSRSTAGSFAKNYPPTPGSGGRPTEQFHINPAILREDDQ